MVPRLALSSLLRCHRAAPTAHAEMDPSAALCREQVAPDEKLVARLLIDSPALPHGGVMAFLRDVCSAGDEWATLALSSCYDIIMRRPPDRLAALQVVLDAAAGPDADIRLVWITSNCSRAPADRLCLSRDW